MRISGPTFTQVTFHIAVPAGVDTDIATAVHVPADPGRVVDRLTSLVDTVQGWVDDPESLPDATGNAPKTPAERMAAADAAVAALLDGDEKK